MKNPFSIFVNSTNSFEGKHDNETVLLYLHRHWFTLLGYFVYAFLGFLIPFILIALFGLVIVKYHLSTLVVFLFSAYYMGLWYMLGYKLTMYVMDIWIVTNQRVIDSTQQGFFNRTISEINLGNIQDITTNVTGAIPTMMNYGDVEVQSAGEVVHFKFAQVPNPQNVKTIISKAMTDYKHEHFKNEAIEVVKEIEKAREEVSTPVVEEEVAPPENLPQ